jgi:maltooligosyltrehalose trehalohydrolase
MRPLRVWAPSAGSVELVLGNARAAAVRGDGGWWTVPAEIAPGTEYAFSVDGGAPRPDPRSLSQPRGPRGASCVVDLAAFHWSDAGFRAPRLESGVVYEIHVGTFSPEGTFEGAIPRLDALSALGITHVELMPVAEGPGQRGWGYDGVGLYAPHHAYGGPAGLLRFVDACHARGLAVLLDVVYNHLGPSGNHLHEFGPYFTDRYRTPWGHAVNLDGRGSDEVRRFFVDNALQWLRDYHIDGLRLDAVHALFDQSAVHFLEELALAVRVLGRDVGRDLVLIAESDLNDPRVVRGTEQGGYGLDAQWSDDFHHALHAVLTGERSGYYGDFGALADVAQALRGGYVYDGRYSAHRGRRHGRPAEGLSGHRFLGYLQNHDQIGNRARGERSGALMSVGRLKIAAALVLTSPFVPLFFQGEEWGARTPFPYFTDHDEPVLAEAVREGRRREFAAFGWSPDEIPDPQAEATFAAARLDWEEPFREPHATLLAWHRDLVRLRRATPALVDGDFGAVHVRWDEEERWMRVMRGPITLAFNLDRMERRVPLERAARIRLASEGAVSVESGAVRLPPDAAAVLETV